MPTLRIEKTKEYVWRVGPFGNAGMSSHNWITAWHVVDVDTGTRVLGGHSQGNNTQSGYAHVPRRMDAAAWIKGWEMAERGEVKFRTLPTRMVVDSSCVPFPGELGGIFELGALAYVKYSQTKRLVAQ